MTYVDKTSLTMVEEEDSTIEELEAMFEKLMISNA